MAPHVSAVLATLTTALATTALLLWGAESATCSQQQLRVFDEVTAQVRACTQASGLTFAMPPQTMLPLTSTTKLCKTPSCTHMLGAVDDLTLPRCEVFFDNRNVTLQSGIDQFASLCDTASPAPSPLKKFTASSSSSSSSSTGAYGTKRKEKKPVVSAARAPASSSACMAQLVAFVALAVLAFTL